MATQRETAQQIWNYLTSRGWTKESVAALLGNMQSESGIIADRWESDIVGNMSGGYGLVQWTPATKYIDWAKSNNLAYQDVISQCKRLEWEVANNQQFYSPNMTFKQFTQSTQSPEVLADIFIRYYERPLNPNQPARQTQARYWYDLLKNTGTVTPTPKEEEEMTEFAIKYGSAMYYVTGTTMTLLTSATQWNVLQSVYSQVQAHKTGTAKSIKTFDWSNNQPTFDAYKSICGYK